MKSKNCKQSDPARLKTRADLGDQEWLVWLALQPEYRGIDVHGLFQKLIEWCAAKRITVTRRRLLRWLDTEREAVPMSFMPEPPRSSPIEPADASPDCSNCSNERFVTETIDPDAKYEWARTRQVPCPACSSINGETLNP